MFFYRKVLILEIIVLFIVFISWIQKERQYQNFWEKTENFGIAKVVSFKEEKEYQNQYIVLYQKHKFLLKTDKGVEFSYGDVIVFTGSFEKAKPARNFELFDYERYLKQNNIYGILIPETIEKISSEKDFWYDIENFKQSLKQNLFRVFDAKQAGFLSGILLGDKSEIEEETKQNFQDSNLSHILAISGMHVAYVVMGFQWILNFLTPRQKWKNGCMIVCLIFFAIFTGASPSCLRACIMCSLIFLSKLVYRKSDVYMSLLIALDIILIINCYYITSIGLWLSFLSTLGIVWGSSFSKPKRFSQWFQFIAENVKISFCCYILILPVIWHCYNKIYLTFIFSNLLVSILIGPIMILGYIHLFLGKFSHWFVFIEKVLLDVLFQIAQYFSHFPFSKILVPRIPVYCWFVYYTLLGSIFYFSKHKDIFLKWKSICIKIGIGLILLAIIFLIPRRECLAIHFLDVGQGDCTLIVTPKGKTILIDGGNNEGYDYGEKVVVPYLLKNGFCQVNDMIISHRRF